MVFGLSKFIEKKFSIINVSIYANILDIIDTGQFSETKWHIKRTLDFSSSWLQWIQWGCFF